MMTRAKNCKTIPILKFGDAPRLAVNAVKTVFTDHTLRCGEYWYIGYHISNKLTAIKMTALASEAGSIDDPPQRREFLATDV